MHIAGFFLPTVHWLFSLDGVPGGPNVCISQANDLKGFCDIGNRIGALSNCHLFVSSESIPPVGFGALSLLFALLTRKINIY